MQTKGASLGLLFLLGQAKRKRPPPMRRKRSSDYAQDDIQTKIIPIFKDLSKRSSDYAQDDIQTKIIPIFKDLSATVERRCLKIRRSQ
ncbi:hypothetical protein ASE92_18920 [Pedobacter sp. Leaf41]|nr:hypothetical protein ASE92_18920 [Pedobacter sp. Leaf41]